VRRISVEQLILDKNVACCETETDFCTRPQVRTGGPLFHRRHRSDLATARLLKPSWSPTFLKDAYIEHHFTIRERRAHNCLELLEAYVPPQYAFRHIHATGNPLVRDCFASILASGVLFVWCSWSSDAGANQGRLTSHCFCSNLGHCIITSGPRWRSYILF
jgi:hypothetical protein